MARDYRAEYQRRKARAQAAGYSSPRAATAARKATPKPNTSRVRDYAAEYRRRQERAQAAGYRSYWEQRRVRTTRRTDSTKVQNITDKFRVAFGNRPRYNEPRIVERLESLFADDDDDVIEELDELTASEMRRIMAIGQPANHRSMLWYH